MTTIHDLTIDDLLYFAEDEDIGICDLDMDDLEWLSSFVEDTYFESQEHGDKEAAEILGSPSEEINCDPENVCAICLDPLQKCFGDMKQLPCKHVYRYNCILTSAKIKNSCPLCREKYDYTERGVLYLENINESMNVLGSHRGVEEGQRKYRGVRQRRSGKWVAQIGKPRLGAFDSLYEHVEDRKRYGDMK